MSQEFPIPFHELADPGKALVVEPTPGALGVLTEADLDALSTEELLDELAAAGRLLSHDAGGYFREFVENGPAFVVYPGEKPLVNQPTNDELGRYRRVQKAFVRRAVGFLGLTEADLFGEAR